jgi:NAD(P)-dependent dehydrogenase (short-subunit alcohol dehydrogenase family)
MELGIKGLRVLVTAGAAGIGLEIARAFKEEGARVHICDVDEAALAAMASSDPGITGSLTDVADRAAVAQLFDDALGQLGGLDVLVNNAGIAGPTGRVEEINPEDWDRCVEVCLTSQFNCARLAVPHLKNSPNASIVNLSSAAGRFGFPLRSPYAAAKWGVIGFTKSLSRELGEFGIRVNAILPGAVAGDRIRRVVEAKAQEMGRSFAEMERDMLSNASLRDYVTARQMADQIVFLASARAARSPARRSRSTVTCRRSPSGGSYMPRQLAQTLLLCSPRDGRSLARRSRSTVTCRRSSELRPSVADGIAPVRKRCVQWRRHAHAQDRGRTQHDLGGNVGGRAAAPFLAGYDMRPGARSPCVSRCSRDRDRRLHLRPLRPRSQLLPANRGDALRVRAHP